MHTVGAAGEPPFQSGSANYPSEPNGLSFSPASFTKDHDGYVHLEGIVNAGTTGAIPGVLFQLPAGSRPPAGQTGFFSSSTDVTTVVLIFGSGVSVEGKNVEGLVLGTAGQAIVLDGIVFRAGS